MSVVVERTQFGELYCPSCETSYPEGRLCPKDQTRLVKLAAHVDPILGRELDGRFTVLEKLGQGGMGAVYRAHQHSVDREVAIKVVSPNLIADPEAIKRFLREAKLTSKLNHPNAVGVLDFGQTDDGVFYLVMELVVGRTLDEVLAADGVFSPQRVVKIGIQVCDALEVAHRLQIIHRDLKPANIMLLASGRDFVKVLDFGLAKSLEVTRELTSSMTGGGRMLGTPAFLPPERVSYGTSDGRSDLYSLGCILYLLASGELPFRATTAPDLVQMHRSQPAPRLARVPDALADVVEKLLEKAPDARFQTAAEVRDALEAAVSLDPSRNTGGFATAATPANPVDPTKISSPGDETMIVPVRTRRAPRRRHVKRYAIAGLAVAGGIALLIGLTGEAPEASNAAPGQPAARPGEPTHAAPAIAEPSPPEPEPTMVGEPEPAEPAIVAEPEPASVAEPEPASVAEPEPANVAEPEPANVAEPEPANVAEPEPVQAEPVIEIEDRVTTSKPPPHRRRVKRVKRVRRSARPPARAPKPAPVPTPKPEPPPAPKPAPKPDPMPDPQPELPF